MAALPLSTVGRTRRKTSVTFSADLFVTVVLGGQDLQRGFNNTATETNGPR